MIQNNAIYIFFAANPLNIDSCVFIVIYPDIFMISMYHFVSKIFDYFWVEMNFKFYSRKNP